MSQIKKTCNICKIEFKIDKFGVGICPNCGMKYSVGAEHRMVLDAVDIGAVRYWKMKNKKIKDLI